MCGLSPYGRPVEEFLLDPPQVLDVKALGIPSIGVHLVDLGPLGRQAVDRVGLTHYPNVADFVEETRRLGVSRKMPPGFPFKELGRDAMLLLAHDRAWIGNAYLYQAERVRMGREHSISEYGAVKTAEAVTRYCPREIEDHRAEDFLGMCAALFWEDVEGGDLTVTAEEAIALGGGAIRERAVDRKIASTEYFGFRRPEGVRPDYAPALFMAVPILGFEVIEADDGSHEAAADRASASAIPVSVCAE